MVESNWRKLDLVYANDTLILKKKKKKNWLLDFLCEHSFFLFNEKEIEIEKHISSRGEKNYQTHVNPGEKNESPVTNIQKVKK